MHRALVMALVLGCGPSSAAVSASANSSSSNGAEAPASRGAASAPLLPETWAELEPHLAGVYVGRLVHRETATPGILEFCEISERIADARSDGGPVPGEWCGSENQPPIGHGWAPAPGNPTWILTRSDTTGTERPFIVQGCEGPCAELPTEEILSEVRCHELSALRGGEHLDHQACTVDDDCAVLSAMCFDAVVSRALAPAYRAALDRHWGECLGPGAGMCPGREVLARCEAGLCTGR